MVYDWASRISWKWGVTAIVTLLTALVVGLIVVLMPHGGPNPAATGVQGSVQLDPPTTSTTTSSTTQPAAVGPGVTDVGISVWASPQMDGSVEVMESAIYASYVDSVTLQPVKVTAAGNEFAGLVPTITHLQVTADGTPVGVLQSLSSSATVSLPVAARHVELRYHLDGVTVRSVPSSVGRASILISPLSVPGDDTARSQIRVQGGTVRNLTCPRLEGDARACAPPSGDLGIAPILAASQDLVIAQVDLPAPS